MYPTSREGFDHALVVLAMGLACWLVPCDGGCRLLVEDEFAASVAEELASFDHESAGWPPPLPPKPASVRRIAILSPLLWAVLVIAAFNLQHTSAAFAENRLDLDAQAVFGHGEWWRVVTSLFVHADLGHLTSNLIFGVFVFSAVLTTLGLARGWLLLVMASIMGNFAAAALQYPGTYRSLGASTAIFAGLGLLTGHAACLVRRHRSPHGWRSVVIPLASGAVLLALLGSGGPEIDVAAHACGFAAGFVIGWALVDPARMAN
jgi:membrane associated rhomboid family serine protease